MDDRITLRRCLGIVLLLLGLLCAAAPAAAMPPLGQDAEEAGDQAGLEEQHKALVTRVYAAVLNQDDTLLATELFADDLVQHDARAGGGEAGQFALFASLKASTPGVVATIKHIAADGDLVAVHWQASATPDDEFTGQAVIDVWRLADGKIVEHWGGFQDVPAAAASGNSMFSDVYTYPQGAPTVSEGQEAANRELAVAAFTDLFNNQNLALLDQVWDPQYVQHNPRFPNGTPALAGLVESAPAGSGPRIIVSQALADGDLVFTIRNVAGGNVAADIWRVVDDKIVEHWDVVPPPPTA
ncbi:MAG: hypothetical protein QOF51_4132 [Chloroflexota bacterium]|jgi:predicted SnoaL-like aldol condensation-catalyzing enzyme|nr:hypothetical protein [Chloroflexota bacterium]